MEAHETTDIGENIQTYLAKAEKTEPQQGYSCHETTALMIVSPCIVNIVQGKH